MLMGKSNAGPFARCRLGKWIVFVREMVEHPEVFISATTRDLGSYRAAIQNALLTRDIFPIQQDNFALAYGQLTDMLRQLIWRCDAVIHLAGFYYGAEPPQRPSREPHAALTRRSNTR